MDFEGLSEAAGGGRRGLDDGDSRGGGGAGQATAFRASLKTAIANRKSAMLLLSQAKANKLQTLCSFLPTIVLRKLSRLTREEASAMRPTREDFHECAVVMLDMCGFTSLAEGLRQGKLLLNNEAGQEDGQGSGGAGGSPRNVQEGGIERRGLAKSYSRTMMSARILRLQTTEEGQAGFGAEQLKVVLNAFFKLLMSTITDHGGDVLRLAGDALIVAFTDGPGQRGVVHPTLLRRAALVSALCLKRLDGMKIQGHVMHLHVALGMGTLELYTVGSAKDGWQYVAAGGPFSDLATAMDEGTAGEIVVSGKYWSSMSSASNDNGSHSQLDDSNSPDHRSSITRTEAADGGWNARALHVLGGVKWISRCLASGNVKIEAAAAGREIETALRRDSEDCEGVGTTDATATHPGADETPKYSCKLFKDELMRKQEFLERVIRRFIPPPILYVCEAEESGWFAEIGRVAVIFVNIAIDGLPGMNVMQSVFLVLQRAMKANQGVIKEFSVDDKGTVMVGALGLPPITGSNPSARACMTALKILEGIQALGIVCYVGISFGPVFTASIGGTRREFMLLGDVVNTAARLMSAGKKMRSERMAARAESVTESAEASEGAPSCGENEDTTNRSESGVIVVESTAAELARGLVEFEKLGTIFVKGKSLPVQVYSPQRPAAAPSSKDGERFAMIGHTELRATLLEKASSLVQGFGGGLLVLQGEPGVGKTRLMDECGREWQREHVQTLGLSPHSSRMNKGAPFSAWSGVMHSVLLLYRSAVLATTIAAETAPPLGSPGDGSVCGVGIAADHAVGVNLGTTNTAMTPASDGESYARGTLADHEEQEDDEGADESKNSKHSLAYSEDAEPDTVAKAEPPQAVASSGGGVSSDGAGGDRLAPEERVTVERGSAQSIAEQLDYETGVLRSMYSIDSTPSDCGRDAEDSSERLPDDGPERRAGKRSGSPSVEESLLAGRSEGENRGRSGEGGYTAATDTQQDRSEEKSEDKSCVEFDMFGELEDKNPRAEEKPLLPWWAGAFGAVPAVEDSPTARGFYTRRFCELFFPDSTLEATEVLCTLLNGVPPLGGTSFSESAGTTQATEKESLQVLASRIPEDDIPGVSADNNNAPDSPRGESTEAAPVAVTPEAPAGPGSHTQDVIEKENADGDAAWLSPTVSPSPSATSADVMQKENADGDSPWVSPAAAPSSSPSPSPTSPATAAAGAAPVAADFCNETSPRETNIQKGHQGEAMIGGDDGGRGGSGATGSHPEGTRFSILLGMLTIATMVGTDGFAVGQNLSVPSPASRSGLGDAGSNTGRRGDIGEGPEATKRGLKGEATVGGVANESHERIGGRQGVIAVIDDGHEMDRCSCDLVKASTKYLHERLLVVLVSPPLPALITNRRGRDHARTTHSGGGSDKGQEDSGDDGGSAESYPSTDSGSEDDQSIISQIQRLSVSGITFPRENTAGEAQKTLGRDSSDTDVAAARLAEDASAGFVPGGAAATDSSRREESHQQKHEQQEGGAPATPFDPATTMDAASSSGNACPGAGGGVSGAENAVPGGVRDTHRCSIGGERGAKRGSRRKGTLGSVSSGRRSGAAEQSGGGDEGAEEKSHHLQIGAAAFMEAARAPSGPNTGKLATAYHDDKRDSGFTRYWNPGTIKLLDILVSLRHKTTVETVRVVPLRYTETVQLGRRHLGCDELDPLVGIALYLLSNGNPLSIVGYCNLMLERNLGDSVPAVTPRPGLSHTAAARSAVPPKTKIAEGEADLSEFGPANPTPSSLGGELSASKEAEVHSVPAAAAGEVEKMVTGVDDGERVWSGDATTEEDKEEPIDRGTTRPQSDLTTFRFQKSINVFRVMEGTIPSGVESRLIDFLSCLSAQQAFVLRVMSVIGIAGIESDLLEAVYPIPVRGSTIREDLEALQACGLVEIDQATPLPPHLLQSNAAEAATAAAAPELTRAAHLTSNARRRKVGSLVLHFRDLVVHQVVYKRLSHNHRKQLHGNIAEWLAEREQKSTEAPDGRDSSSSSGVTTPEPDARRGSFEGGKAAAEGRVLSPAQAIPLLVHHLTLAHQEQKAMIRAHLYGVRELESWAMGAFAAMLDKRAACVPDELMDLARKCKDLMWLCPSLIGILKTVLAIRSGAGVSNATVKFRRNILSSRKTDTSGSGGADSPSADEKLPEVGEEEEREEESKKVATQEGGESHRRYSQQIPETACTLQRGPETLEGSRPRSSPACRKDLCRSSTAAPFSSSRERRDQPEPPKHGKRPESRSGNKKRGKRVSPQLSPLSPSGRNLRSLAEALSVYSPAGARSDGSTFGLASVSVHASRRARPRTTGFPSAALIFVTTRSPFSASTTTNGAVHGGGVGSRAHPGRGTTQGKGKRATTAPGRGKSEGKASRSGGAPQAKIPTGLVDAEGTLASVEGGEAHGGRPLCVNVNPPQRPRTVPMVDVPSGEQQDSTCWFRRPQTCNSSSRRFRERDGARRAHNRLGPSGPGTAEALEGFTILSPERAAARLANLYRAYGSTSFSDGRSTVALKSMPSVTFSAEGRGSLTWTRPVGGKRKRVNSRR